jgi:hypothetical protein
MKAARSVFLSVFLDEGSPGVQRIFRHFQIMTFPGMIGRLLEDLFDRLPVDLEIAVQARFVETQYLHDIRSPAGGSPVRRNPRVRFNQNCIKQMSCQTSGSPGDDSQSPFSGPLRIPPPWIGSGRGVTKMSCRACCDGFIARLCPAGPPSFGGFPAATWMSQQLH